MTYQPLACVLARVRQIRHAEKRFGHLEVWEKKGWLRSDVLIGKARMSLNALLAQPAQKLELHLDERKAVMNLPMARKSAKHKGIVIVRCGCLCLCDA